MPEKQNNINNSIRNDDKRAPFYFYVIMLIIPIVFILILETGLRVFNYGRENEQWIEAAPGYYMLHPMVAKRYFSKGTAVPSSNQDVFTIQKNKNAFRVFVFGGSSAAGYPYLPIGSFSRYLQRILETAYPSTKIEVVNLSMTAVNSYTIRDLTSGVIEQKPDLFLIYAGHNEYYGALGVGSMETLGQNRDIVNFLLYLDRFKTFELLQDFLGWAIKLFSEKEKVDGTLMSKIAKEKNIPYESEMFNAGIEQFKGNISDVIEMAKEAGIPVIIGTLASNLKDQPPFVSKNSDKYQSAENVYGAAKDALAQGNTSIADSLFRFAKDLDQLRFRAPEKLNKVIKELGEKYKIPVLDIDRKICSMSPDGITDNNFMTDHLHLTLEGYREIGKMFYESMKLNNYLPKGNTINLPDSLIYSMAIERHKFSKFDSVVAEYRLALLRNDWPFIDKAQKRPTEEILVRKDFVDSIAYNSLTGKIEWSFAQQEVAKQYLKRNMIDKYIYQMDVIIGHYPVVIEFYEKAAENLIQLKYYETAHKFLEDGYKIKPTAFITKWLGSINLNNGQPEKAIVYLEQSIKLKNDDAQVYHNLAGAYYTKEKYEKALEYINTSLILRPKYQNAIELKKAIELKLKSSQL